MTRNFWIDTDTASDDAVALVMALRHPDIEVLGISVVAGNVPLDQAVQNALYTRELCERTDVPIYVGADAPLQVPLETAQNVHGIDGMGDIGLPLHGRSPDVAPAGGAIDELLAASQTHDLTLVTLGPLTNIAIALDRDPRFAERVDRVVAMGAVADHIGNVSPIAEFNMWADPHAAALVVASALPLEFVGWDVSRNYAVIDQIAAEEILAIGTPLAEFAINIQSVVTDYCDDETGLDGFDLPDPIAMAYAIDPQVARKVERYFIEVETESPITRGAVVMDVLNLQHREPNATVVVSADRARFMEMLRAAVS